MAGQVGGRPQLSDSISANAGEGGSPEPGDAGALRDVLATFEDAPVLLLELAGPDLTVVSANRMARSMIAPRGAGVIGRRLADMAAGPGGRQIADAIKDVYATGVPAWNADWRVPPERGSGSHGEELTFSFSARPAYHPDGSIRGVLIAGSGHASQPRPRPEAWAAAGAWQGQQPAARDAVLTLQRHMLPAALPVLPRIRLAARYLAAADYLNAGGDWFDAIALPGGATALAVGGVTGHGPEAIAAMSQLRAVLREALLEGAAPVQALARLDAFAAQFPATRGATACLGVLDPRSGELGYASAGHPMPLCCLPAGSASFLPPAAGGPLGVGASLAALASAVLPPVAVLLLYSSGLVGRPGQGAQHGRQRLADAAASVLAGAGSGAAADTADRMCGAVAEWQTAGGHDADLTVLAAHRLVEPVPSWSMQFPADPEALRDLRSRLRTWLQELSVTPLDTVDTELAVYEAASNAIMHGQPRHGPATVTVQVGLDGTGGALIQVIDRGEWQPGDAPHSGPQRSGGRGLQVVSKVTDELSIVPSPSGTTITMRRALSRPVAIGPPAHGDASGSRASSQGTASSGEPVL